MSSQEKDGDHTIYFDSQEELDVFRFFDGIREEFESDDGSARTFDEMGLRSCLVRLMLHAGPQRAQEVFEIAARDAYEIYHANPESDGAVVHYKVADPHLVVGDGLIH